MKQIRRKSKAGLHALRTSLLYKNKINKLYIDYPYLFAINHTINTKQSLKMLTQS